MKKNKILYLIATLDIGGTEKQLLTLLKGLDKNKYEPIVCCLRRGGPFKEEIESLGIKVIILGKKSKYDISIIPKLIRLIKKEKPIIVHTFLWTSNFWGRIASIICRVPVIISGERCVDLWKGWFEFSADKILSYFTDKIISNAFVIKKFLVSNGISNSKIEVVYNGLDFSIYEISYNTDEIKKELNIDFQKHIIGFVGRLSYQKNPQMFVDIAKKILRKRNDVQFLIIGDGELRQQVEEQIKKYDIENKIKILGYRKDIPRILQIIDIVVFTSRWEGLPNVLLEASASAKPVVASDVDGVREVVIDKKTGFVISLVDEEGFLNAILKLLDSPVEAMKMGKEGRNFVRETFGVSKFIKNIEKIYEEELEKCAI